jgi:predicted small metal-binding protein
MSKYIECEDMFPGCEFKAEADSEAELLKKVADHAASIHGLTEITEDMVSKVKGCIRDA